ncbi:MAG: hypothetical protein ISR76_08060 [Planctomycetes bacterium]|nr:hypothetical protein [Planctomycetota bacterium]
MLRLATSLLLLLPLAAPLTAQNCDPLRTDLIAGQHTTMGTVTVSNTPTELHVLVKAGRFWRIENVHIYAGPGPLPTNGGGNVAPGQFPFKTSYNPAVRFHDELIPLSVIGQQCGDDSVVAVHCDVVELDAGGNVVRSETAWGFGTPFTGSQWGWSIDFDICCSGCDTSGALDLTVDPLRIGAAADLPAAGATPGAKVKFFANCGLVACGIGAFCAGNPGDRIDLVAPIFAKTSAIANANGDAVVSFVVPPSAAVGRVYGLQAAYYEVINGALVLVKSNPVLARVLP